MVAQELERSVPAGTAKVLVPWDMMLWEFMLRLQALVMTLRASGCQADHRNRNGYVSEKISECRGVLNIREKKALKRPLMR